MKRPLKIGISCYASAGGSGIVASELGLHARPASQFVALAGGFECDIRVGRGDDQLGWL